jgi:hypothetical protein
MVDLSAVNGSSSNVPLLNFAECWLDSVNKDGSITVTFIQTVSPGNLPGPNNTSTSCVKGNSGVCTVVLEQ